MCRHVLCVLSETLTLTTATVRQPDGPAGPHEHRGRMHAQGACLPCRVRPVRTLGAAAMPPPTGAARRRAGERGTFPAAPHPPTSHDGRTQDAAAAPSRRQTRTQPTTNHATTDPVVPRTRACGPQPPQPPPTHRPPSTGGSRAAPCTCVAHAHARHSTPWQVPAVPTVGLITRPCRGPRAAAPKCQKRTPARRSFLLPAAACWASSSPNFLFPG